MRLIQMMTFVFAMLLLAMIPACLHFSRMAGLQPSVSLATAGVVSALALFAARRPF